MPRWVRYVCPRCLTRFNTALPVDGQLCAVCMFEENK